MLNGDTGMSNTDPWATKPAPGNNWIKTGPHVMMAALVVKKMAGFPRRPDPDPTKPYVMWSGTPYEHVNTSFEPEFALSGGATTQSGPPRSPGREPSSDPDPKARSCGT